MYFNNYEHFGIVNEMGEVVSKEAVEQAVKDSVEAEIKEGAKVASKEAGEEVAKQMAKSATKDMIKDATKNILEYVAKNPLKTLALGTVTAAGVEAAISGKKFADVLAEFVKKETDAIAPAVSDAVDAGIKGSEPIVGAAEHTFLKIMKSLFGKFAYYIEIALISLLILGVVYFIYENFYKNRAVIIEKVQSKFKMGSSE